MGMPWTHASMAGGAYGEDAGDPPEVLMSFRAGVTDQNLLYLQQTAQARGIINGPQWRGQYASRLLAITCLHRGHV